MKIFKTTDNTTSQDNFTHTYIVLFEASPSDGIFESRLYYDSKANKIQLNGDILRINLYGQTSSCIQDKYDLRSFCYCITYHKRLKNDLQNANYHSSNTALINSTKD